MLNGRNKQGGRTAGVQDEPPHRVLSVHSTCYNIDILPIAITVSPIPHPAVLQDQLDDTERRLSVAEDNQREGKDKIAEVCTCVVFWWAL